MGGRAVFKLGRSVAIGLIILSSLYIITQAQSTPGFLSIDCGITTPYTDKVTPFQWVGDGSYTLTGTNGTVTTQVDSIYDNSEALQTFTYFPERRNKHCYDLPTTSNQSLLLRAMFLHGSSSQLIRPIVFDVAVNGTVLDTVQYTLDDVFDTLMTPKVIEAIFLSTGNLTHFCLVPDTGVPFVSSLELRQLDTGITYSFNGSNGQLLRNLYRVNCGATVGSSTVRYPDDQYDRLWYTPGDWAIQSIQTSNGIQNSQGSFNPSTIFTVNDVPAKVMQDAWLGNDSFSATFGGLGSFDSKAVVFLYFEETQSDVSAGARVFDLYMNASGNIPNETLITVSNSTVTPENSPNLLYLLDLPLSNGVTFNFSSPPNSTLGPILNAIEIFGQYEFNTSATAAQDVDALKTLQVSFNLSDWQGDPCYPVSWDWVNCKPDVPARVDQLLLSNKGITGSIPSTISDLDSLTQIHLDNNSLYGAIPDSLASLRNLTFLNLNNNNLSGEVPSDLSSKLGLNFSYSGNALLGLNPTTQKKKKSTNIGVLLGAIVGGIFCLGLALGLAGHFFSKRKRSQRQVGITLQGNETASKRQLPLRQFNSYSPQGDDDGKLQLPGAVGLVSYETLKIATDDFKLKIGQGSYGSVYHGRLNNKAVAVKLNNVESQQGHNEFITEIDILTRVHHKNLVSLIGYCNQGKQLILIYEYQANGTLRDWLRDERGTKGILDWNKRLQIAADAAKGLEYLHKGCKPTIIHRDVKSSNILLDENMVAKVADFGLSKSAPGENTSGYSTGVKGTPGYLDPEYYALGRLTHKSDVYSFGVVLAEIITGRPPFQLQSEGQDIILVEWMRRLVERNDLQALVDPKLDEAFDPESMWRMADVTLSCLDPVGGRRPDFTQVVLGINEAIELEKRDSSVYYAPLVTQANPLVYHQLET